MPANKTPTTIMSFLRDLNQVSRLNTKVLVPGSWFLALGSDLIDAIRTSIGDMFAESA